MTGRACLNQMFAVLATFVVIMYSTPSIITVLIPVLIVYYIIQVSDCMSVSLRTEYHIWQEVLFMEPLSYMLQCCA